MIAFISQETLKETQRLKIFYDKNNDQKSNEQKCFFMIVGKDINNFLYPLPSLDILDLAIFEATATLQLLFKTFYATLENFDKESKYTCLTGIEVLNYGLT